MDNTDFEIAFVVPGLEGAFDPRVSQVEEAMDVVASSHSRLSVATVIVPGENAVEAGRHAAAVLSSCGLPPVKTYPDLVSRQDIADRLDVSRQAVGNWVRGDRQQANPFPAPVHMVAGSIWLWGDIVAWLRRTGRECDELEFPTMLDHALLDALLARARDEQAPLREWAS